MAEGTSNSLVNLGDLSKPADTLIKKVAKAVGGIFEPAQIRRVAKAKADAAVIEARAEIEITDLHRRAMHRFVEEEAQRQKNIEDITAKALPQLNETAKPDSMEDDWVTNFFDKSRIVSDEQMQYLWSSVLAGEANAPGTYSKRTVNFLSDLDKRDAEMFSKLCEFVWKIGDLVPLVFDIHAKIYNQHGVDFDALMHLENIGLVKFNTLVGFRRVELPNQVIVQYQGRRLILESLDRTEGSLQIGTVLLTKVGQELAPICGSGQVDGFWDYVKDKWSKHSPKEIDQGKI